MGRVMKEPFLQNKHAYAKEAYQASLAYCRNNPRLWEQIAGCIWAWQEIQDLIPQTLENFVSGHAFPYQESYSELEVSYELTLQGFYRHGLFALRSTLELGILGLYFAREDLEHLDVPPWIRSEDRTPWLQQMLDELSGLSVFDDFDRQFGLFARVRDTQERLSQYVHVRGYRHSSRSLNAANFNRFSEKSLLLYFDELIRVVRDLLTMVFLKYPVGMQGLPLTEKCGINGPAGGFLEEFQVRQIVKVLVPEERSYLQTLSDNDPGVKAARQHFERMPDITEEELQQQFKDFDEMLPSKVPS